MYLHRTVWIFLLTGAISGALSALGVIFVDKGILISNEDLVAVTPAVAYSSAIILSAYLIGVSLKPIQLIALPLLLYLSWYLAVQAAVGAADYVTVPLSIIVGGVVGAGLLAILLSVVFHALRKVQPIAIVSIAGAIGALPFVVSDRLELGENAGYFVLFVIWQALVAATIGYFVRDTDRQLAAIS